MSRLVLHDKLCSILGTSQVYYQPPESLKLQYPCIIYKLDNLWQRNANNRYYVGQKRYTIQVIDKDPESPIWENLLQKLPKASFDRSFVVDNLHHFNLTLYF